MQQLEWYEGMGCELRGTRSTAAHSAYRQWKRRTSLTLLRHTPCISLLTFKHKQHLTIIREGGLPPGLAEGPRVWDVCSCLVSSPSQQTFWGQPWIS